jgi:hypothetical protein
MLRARQSTTPPHSTSLALDSVPRRPSKSLQKSNLEPLRRVLPVASHTNHTVRFARRSRPTDCPRRPPRSSPWQTSIFSTCTIDCTSRYHDATIRDVEALLIHPAPATRSRLAPAALPRPVYRPTGPRQRHKGRLEKHFLSERHRQRFYCLAVCIDSASGSMRRY